MAITDLVEQIKHYCAYQDRCQSEVRQKLLSLSFSGQDLEEVIVLLIEEGFLNEERYARSYCRGKFNLKHWGKRKIIQHLKRNRISDYCIQKGLEEIEEIEYERVFEKLYQKKLASLASEKSYWVKKKKIREYLLSKGYEHELIYTRLKSIK